MVFTVPAATTSTASSSSPHDDDTSTATEIEKEQASNVIVRAFGDHALLVLRAVIGQPGKMMEKLDAQYDSKTTARKISTMVELVSVRYKSLDASMHKKFKRIAGLVENITNMVAPLHHKPSVGILLASVEAP